MEKTEELDIEIEDIGTILKSSRLKSKKTLEEISSELCIRRIYLIALEEGDYQTLEPIPYGVGYMRTYAKYLGLNPDRAVKLYKTASNIEEKPVIEEENIPEVNRSSWLHIGSGILAVILIYAIWSGYSSNADKEKIEKSLPEVVAEEEISQPTEVLSTTLMVTKDTTVAEDLKAVEEEKTPVAPEPQIENNKVIVEFLGESWVELKDKNKVYFQGVFHDGDKKEIDYIDNLFISVGRPRNVKIFIKGQEKNILVKKRKMNIPLDSLE